MKSDEKKNENGNKEQDSRVKTRKGGLEQKWENFQRLAGKAKKKEEWKGNDQTASKAYMRSFTPSEIEKIWTFYSRMTSPEFPSLSRWVLTLVKLPYSRTTKMNLFKMLDFQRIHFSKKKALEMRHLFA